MTFTLDALRLRLLQDHVTVQNDTALVRICNFTGETIIFTKFSIDGKRNNFLDEQNLQHGDMLNVTVNTASAFGWAEGDRIEWNLDYEIADPMLMIYKA